MILVSSCEGNWTFFFVFCPPPNLTRGLILVQFCVAHFERRITFGVDADFSGGVKAKFDGSVLNIEGEIIF